MRKSSPLFTCAFKGRFNVQALNIRMLRGIDCENTYTKLQSVIVDVF